MGNNFQAKTEAEREFKKVFETINYAKNREWSEKNNRKQAIRIQFLGGKKWLYIYTKETPYFVRYWLQKMKMNLHISIIFWQVGKYRKERKMGKSHDIFNVFLKMSIQNITIIIKEIIRKNEEKNKNI